MAKKIAASALDAALAVLAGADRLVALSVEPADYAGAAGNALATAVLLPADLVIGAGTSGARRLTVGAKAGVAVDNAGTASHVALLDSVGGALLYVTTCPDAALEVGGTADFSGFTVEVGPLS